MRLADAPLRYLTRGQYLYYADTEPQEVFLVAAGGLRLEYLSNEGYQLDVLVGAGELVGDAEAIAGLPRQANAVATSREARVRAVTREEFLATVTPDVIRALALRCLASDRRAQEMAYRPALQRLSVILRRLVDSQGRTLTLTHENIGHLVGVSRETATRCLGRLQAAGVVAIDHGRIRILRPELLRDHV